MESLRWVILAAVLAASGGWIHGTVSNCPMGLSYPDGCVGAPVGGNVQYSNFFTSRALQSGQTYTTRPPWNVAGVDYAIGISASAFPLKDPTTAPLPTGCSFASNTVTCGGTAADITFDGWDFGLHNCTYLNFQGTATGNLIVRNSNFLWGTNTQCNQFALVNLGVNLASILWEKNVSDGVGDALTLNDANMSCLVGGIANSTPVTVQYSVFYNAPARQLCSSGTGSIVWQYNYGEGLTYIGAKFTGSISGTVLTVTAMTSGTIQNGSGVWSGTPGLSRNLAISSFGTGAGGVGTYNLNTSSTLASGPLFSAGRFHGDPQLLTFTTGTMALFQHSYSTFLSTSINVGGTAGITPQEFAYTSQVMTLFQADHNVIVSNLSALYNTGATLGALVGNNSAIVFTNTTWDTNYMDPTGAFFCFVFSAHSPGSGAPAYSGNINLRDGSSIPDQTLANCHGHQ